MRNKQNASAMPINGRNPTDFRLERWHRWCLYGSCAWLVATGVLFLIGHFFLRPASAFGEAVHPLEPWSMRLHGAGAMVALFFLGSIMNGHIRRALKSGRNLYSGLAMIVSLLALTATGYGLYYVGSESDRPVWSTVHWLIGLVLPVVFILHIVLGRLSRPRRLH
jgi:hypothetical protein